MDHLVYAHILPAPACLPAQTNQPRCLYLLEPYLPSDHTVSTIPFAVYGRPGSDAPAGRRMTCLHSPTYQPYYWIGGRSTLFWQYHCQHHTVVVQHHLPVTCHSAWDTCTPTLRASSGLCSYHLPFACLLPAIRHTCYGWRWPVTPLGYAGAT